MNEKQTHDLENKLHKQHGSTVNRGVVWVLKDP